MTKYNTQPIIILMADDDADDRLLIKEAFQESHVTSKMDFVENGIELLDYLHKRGKYRNASACPMPDLILLDLNMPCKDGRETLQEIKADPHLRQIPVIVLTTSKAEEDIFRSYDLGAAGFITKPVTFDGLVHVVKGLGDYWIELVKLPSKEA